MTSQPPDNVASNLAEFLSEPVESLDVEYSAWMDIEQDQQNRASIAKELIALANHGGGYLIFGFKPNPQKQLVPDLPRPQPLKGYDVDTINSIVRRFAEPPFQCDVRTAVAPTSGHEHPIVIVPGRHRVPIRSTRGVHPLEPFAYYCRTPGPNSERPQSGRDWDAILDRCINVRLEDERDHFVAHLTPIVETLFRQTYPRTQPPQDQPDPFEEFIRQSVNRFEKQKRTLGPDENPTRYDHGVWTFAYHVTGTLRTHTDKELLDLLGRLSRYTGWPPWNTGFSAQSMRPYPFEDNIECWLKDGGTDRPAQSDFWRIRPSSYMFFSLSGYDDDNAISGVEAGKYLDPILVVWRVGERVMHALNLAHLLALSEDTSIEIRVEWEGLKDRRLETWSNPAVKSSANEVCHQESTVRAQQTIKPYPDFDEPYIPVFNLLEPLAKVFNFAELPLDFVRRELVKMIYRTP